MTFLTVFKLFLASLIPVAFAVGFVFLGKLEKFKKIPWKYRMFLYGIVFGGSSILGTVLGAPLANGAIVNVRDASPIICGLIFGGPAGILAGAIGGAYRAISVLWAPKTSYTVVACSISTFMAGIFTAIIRTYIFGKKHGTWYYGFFLGVLVEDFHMALAVLTHFKDITEVYEKVVSVCAIPMILLNSIAVTIALIVVSLINKEKLIFIDKKRHIATKVQFTLMGTLIISYICTAYFTYLSINRVIKNGVTEEANKAITDVISEVDSSVDIIFKEKLNEVITLLPFDEPDNLNAEMNSIVLDQTNSIDEINIVGKDQIIRYSSRPEFINQFDMSEKGQSVEFCYLSNDETYTPFIQKIDSTSNNEEVRMKYAGVRLHSDNDNISYLQFAMNENSYHALLKTKVSECANFRHIKNNGFVVVATDIGDVVSSSSQEIGEEIDLKTIIGQEIYKDKYYLNYQAVEGYYVIAFSEMEESNLPVKVGFTAVSLAEIFVFLILYTAIYINVKKSVVDKIQIVSEGLDKISNGDLNVEINERHSMEFNLLSDDINKTVKTLKDNIEREANKNAEELKFAKSIQYSVLPTIFPMNDKFEIYASMSTAKTVGGDFYDFYYIDYEHVLIEIADVSGKGVPAAMFMMRAKTLLKSLIESGMDIDLAFSEANRILCAGNETQTFITAWAGIIDLSTGHLEYVNAGHNPPIIRKSNKFEYLKSTPGFVLAGLDGFVYKKQSIELSPGDIIYLYTDGVTEANNPNKELYGEARLLEDISKRVHYNAKELCEEVTEKLSLYVKDAEQSDDITMLAFKLYNIESTNIKVVDATLENLPEIMSFVDDLLDRNGASFKAKTQIDVAVDEIFSNIAFYAYPKGQIGKAKISLIFSKDSNQITIIFEDRGKAYNPLEKADPDTSLSIEEKSIGGLGIFIVKNTMDSMEYENVNGHNVLTLKKIIK